LGAILVTGELILDLQATVSSLLSHYQKCDLDMFYSPHKEVSYILRFPNLLDLDKDIYNIDNLHYIQQVKEERRQR
jgi:hypothetical protein